MRKFALLSAAALTLGTLSLGGTAQAQGYGHGYRGGGFVNRGPVAGYGYRGGRRGISTGAAVGLGVAGLAAGAIAADAYRRNGYGYGGYGYGAPAYGYGGGPGYYEGY